MRQILAVLLCVVMVLGLMSPAIRAAETEEALLEVTLAVYSDREGYLDVDGLYRDNVLYIDAETVCRLTGARIHARDDRSVTFSLHDGLRHITVSADGDGRLIEEVIMGRAYSFGADVPVVSYNGAVYASATHLLRYMGAVVGFGENETSETHMTVSMPYTILDLIVDFTDAEGYFFSWSEADGKYVDPEDAVTLAAIDTILLGYDSNILAYAVPGHADKIEKEYYTDVLNEILRTEGAELTDDGYNEVDLFGDASDTWSFSASWIGEVLGWIEDDTLLTNLNKSMSGALNTTGVLLSAGGDYLDSLNAAMQFANMSTHQKELLDNTLNKIPENNAYYQALPMLFEAAEEVSDMISGRYDANKKAAWDGIYSIMVNAGTSMLNSLNPFAIAWDSLTTVAKLDPLTGGLLDDEKSITYAMECHNVEIIAWNLLQADYSDLWTHNFYMFTDDTEVQEWLRLDMILALKSCLTARTMLLGTGWLTEASQNTMEMTAEWTAKLLNKAQNAKPVTMGILDNREEDITWIKNLAGSYTLGWVQSAGENTYYWKFTSDDYGDGAYWAYFSQAEDTAVELIQRSPAGRETELFQTEVATDFVVLDDHIYYSAHAELVIFDQKTGTTDYTGLWGNLCGVTNSGSYLVCEYDGDLYTYHIADGAWTLLAADAEYVACYKNRIYYSKSPEYSIASQGQISVYSTDPAGENTVLLCTTKPDLYPANHMSEAMVAQIRFGEEYVFFSYGSIGGTGSMYQGGNIIRVGYDGSDPAVVATGVGTQFSITEDKVIDSNSEDSYSTLFGALNDYYETNDGLIYMDPVSGKTTVLLTPEEYEDESAGIATVVEVAIQNGKAYVLVHYGTRDPSNDLGWREYYQRRDSVMYEKDLKTGELTELYRF